MSKYLVETYYTCTFKITHKLNELNEKKLSELEKRKDGEVKIIDVKLNNRKTKTTNKNEDLKNNTDNNSELDSPDISSIVNQEVLNSDKLQDSNKIDNVVS